MTTYVLVGDAWLGGWCWQPIARRLRNAGHDAYPLTLTGLGERVHLASPEVDLQTHITDVVNLLEFEDLRDVVLRSEEHTSELQSRQYLVCRLLLEKKNIEPVSNAAPLLLWTSPPHVIR